MEAYIVTDSTNYEERAFVIGEALRKKGYKTEYIFSCFNHALKKKGRKKVPGQIYIDAGSYKRNISPARLFYHHRFALKTRGFLKDKDIDLLYVLLPGNSLAPAAARIKAEKGCRLIFDIIDLWPESLPLEGFDKLPFFYYWKGLRDKYLDKADTVITECGLYARELGLKGQKTRTLYWVKQEETSPVAGSVPSCGSLNIAYIGSMNNIIDIAGITDILKAISDKVNVKLHIIGTGESKDLFLKSLENCGIAYRYYGTVYDKQEKERILRQCTWGINIMKPGVRVGLTMKSIDYMANGLRLINNIPGDTWDMVDKFGLGINADGTPEKTAEALSCFAGRTAREIYEFYREHFTVEAAGKILDEVL